MTIRLAFLMGTGASKGAGGVMPYDPPLGSELYDRLREHFPGTWGTVSEPLDALFRDNFELGIAELWANQSSGSSQLIIEMGLYFSMFGLPADGSDCYSRLLSFLATDGLIPQTVMTTLNYEIVLDIAASNLGLRLAYLLPGADIPAGNLYVLKPHGSCNWLPAAEVSNLALVGSGREDYYEGRLRFVQLPEMQQLYRNGFALPPAMSLFAPGKNTPVARAFVDEIRNRWATLVASSEVVIVLGARPLLADTHIWQPILDSSQEVWYVGGSTDDNYREFKHRLGDRLTHVAERLPQGLNSLLERLSQRYGRPSTTPGIDQPEPAKLADILSIRPGPIPQNAANASNPGAYELAPRITGSSS
jgi:hypothetical protein